jgi:hypothetical protein
MPSHATDVANGPAEPPFNNPHATQPFFPIGYLHGKARFVQSHQYPYLVRLVISWTFY